MRWRGDGLVCTPDLLAAIAGVVKQNREKVEKLAASLRGDFSSTFCASVLEELFEVIRTLQLSRPYYQLFSCRTC